MTIPFPDSRRVVITGMGALTPLGNSVDAFWQGCVEGRSGIDWITLVDVTNYSVKVDGEVRGFDPQDFMDRKEARRMARFSQFSVAAARMAIEDSGLRVEQEDANRIGVLLGNGNGGFPETDEAVKTIVAKGGNRIDPFYMSKTLPNMAAAQVAMQFGLKGYNNTVTTARVAQGLAAGGAGPGRRGRHHPLRPGRRDGRRRRRGGHLRAGARGLPYNARPLDPGR